MGWFRKLADFWKQLIHGECKKVFSVKGKNFLHNILLYIRRSLWKFRIFFPQIHFASEYSKGKRGLNTKLYLLKITNQRTDLLCDSHINFIFMQVFSYSCCCFFFKNFEVRRNGTISCHLMMSFKRHVIYRVTFLKNWKFRESFVFLAEVTIKLHKLKSIRLYFTKPLLQRS